MATITHVTTQREGGTYVTLWETMDTPDVGTSLSELPGASDRSVQVIGTFDGATVTMQGSNQVTPTVWNTLHDIAGDDCDFANAAGIKMISENPRHIRPIVSAGTTVDVDVYVLSRGTR